MNGIFLQGGGAKGAFQAGVIYALNEEGIEFNVVAGTSIGAFNSYFIYTGNFEKLKDIWLNMSSTNNTNIPNEKEIKVVDNGVLMKILEDFDGINHCVSSVFINYVEVENCSLKEVKVDITKLSKNEAINAIKYSSLLPCRIEKGVTLKDFINNFDSRLVFDNFKLDLSNGEYNGYKLDGSILNRNFLEPFSKHKVDKLYMVVFNKEYVIPEYILENYKREDIIVIEPDSELSTKDTFRFEKEFCKNLFEEGYNIVKAMLQ